jgi:formylglycine-generating enzyme required for sulfatase activity
VVVSGANQPEVAVAPQSARPTPTIAIAALVLLAAPVPGAAGGGEGAQDVRRRLTQCRAPVIVTQPVDVTIPSGEAATLTVVATGLAPLAFQWYRGESGDASAPVGTDSPSFTTPPFGATASYWARVSNACGQASSRTALVTVSGLPAQEITLYLGPGDTVPLVLVRIPGGTPFTMGAPAGERGSSAAEMPQHQVTIARDFYLGKYEVTQAQWQAVMGWNPSLYFGVGPDYPVYDVSWSAIAGQGGFIDRLNQALGTTAFRLPTEAEWEYAARAGTTTSFPFPAPADWDTECGSFPAAEPHMWWCGNGGPGTHPVGERLPNPWGLFDMSGNVWEWVQDCWHDDYAGDPPTDGNEWETSAAACWARVMRGGSWQGLASRCRPAQRHKYYPDQWGHGVNGFRLAMSE